MLLKYYLILKQSVSRPVETVISRFLLIQYRVDKSIPLKWFSDICVYFAGANTAQNPLIVSAFSKLTAA